MCHFPFIPQYDVQKDLSEFDVFCNSFSFYRRLARILIRIVPCAKVTTWKDIYLTMLVWVYLLRFCRNQNFKYLNQSTTYRGDCHWYVIFSIS